MQQRPTPGTMNTAAALRSLYTSTLRRPIPIYGFLVPVITQGHPNTQHASITTSSSAPSTEPKPEALNSSSSAKRRRPLSPSQKQFLDSAVSVISSLNGHQYSHLTAHFSLAPRQPSGRTRRHPNLHRANAPDRQSASAPASPNAAYVRPRSRPLLHLQPTPRAPPHPPHSHVPGVETGRHRSGLGHSGDGAGGGDGVYGGCGDGDWRAL